MIYENNCTLPKEYLEQFINQGLEGLPDLIRTLVNEAMQIERENFLGAKPYERSQERQGHANGYKPKTVKTRVGEVTFDIPQVREGGFYPRSLEKGMRSERALLLALAEMYVQECPRAKWRLLPRSYAVHKSAPARSAVQANSWTMNWKHGEPDLWERWFTFTWMRVTKKCGRQKTCEMRPY